MRIDDRGGVAKDAPSNPLHRTVDLDLGELQELELCDGTNATVKLLDVEEIRDPLRSAVRQARVKVAVNGKAVTLVSGTYHLPVTVAGVQIDCPVTKGHYRDCDPWEDSWGLDKYACLRLWPAGSPWIAPGTFVYPAKQRWFASATQMANEPSFVDGGDAPSSRKIYYHSGLDIGGCEGNKVRSFRVPAGDETWDFGDGSPPVKVRSDGNAEPMAPDGYAETVHRFARPGDYLVRVEGTGHTGTRAVAHLHVRVDENARAAAEPEGKSWEG